MMLLSVRILLPVLLAVFCARAACALPAAVIVELFRARNAGDRVLVRGPFKITSPSNIGHSTRGTEQIRAAGDGLDVTAASGGRGTHITVPITIEPVGDQITLSFAGATRTYKGWITLRNDGGKLVIRNRVPMRDYIKSVVGSETNPEFSVEALKAQAVCSQTLMARYKPGDVLNDTTEKQAYLGADYVRKPVSEAVDAVFGQILTYNGRPANIYFHASCNGGTSDGEIYFELKKGTAPYLRSVVCNYCKGSPFAKPKVSVIPRGRFQPFFGAEIPEVTCVDQQRRPLKVQVASGSKSGFAFWTEVGQKLGWDKVPGTRYLLREMPSRDIEFTSTGAGHGVGLCQWGADGLAHSHKTYREILDFYFPGTSISR